MLGALRVSIFAPPLYAFIAWATTNKFVDLNVWMIKKYTPNAALLVLFKDTLLFFLRRSGRKHENKSGVSQHDSCNKMSNWRTALKWLLP